MIEVTGPAAVLMTISETTLSDPICSIVPEHTPSDVDGKSVELHIYEKSTGFRVHGFDAGGGGNYVDRAAASS